VSGPAVTLIATKQDMSRWARAHADMPGIPWSVQAGPGGTMVITELDGDRCALAGSGGAAAQGAAS
jgi:hypothetical protein